MKSQTPRFDVLESPVVARIAALPVQRALELFDAADPLEATRSFYAANAFARDAVAIASPSLAAAIDEWLAGTKDDERIALRALSYALRMSSRSTPFGVFAGVGSVDVGDATTLAAVPQAFRTQTRPDMGAIGTLVAEVEASDARKRLRYVRNACSFVRGNRLYVVNVDLANLGGPDGLASEQRDVSLRCTPAVALVRTCCEQPAKYGEIVLALCERFGASASEAERLVDRLATAGVIVSELRVSPLGDPVGRLLARLRAVAPERALDLAASLDAAASLDETPVFEQTRAQRESLTQPTQTDLRVVFSGTLGKAILADVATLAELNVRSGVLFSLQRYRERFMERYEGTTRLVPLLELTHNSFGLGAPETPELGDGASLLAMRHFLSEATRESVAEADLRGELFDKLFPPAERGRIEAIEVAFQLAASSREALDRGDYRLVHSSIFDRAGRSVARFASMLGDQFVASLRNAVRSSVAPGEFVAEFTYAPISSRSYNVMLRPPFHDHEIAARVLPLDAQGAIAPDDLFVGLDDDRFYLWSKRLQRRVSVRETHALMTAAAPNLCRFLALLFADGARRADIPLHHFEDAPYMPRLTYGRVVLRERTWMISKNELGSSPDNVRRALERRRERLNMPRYLRLCEGDNELLLDLDSAVSAKLLLAHAAADEICIKEMLPAPGESWLAGDGGTHIAEFVAQAIPRVLDPPVERSAQPFNERKRFGPGSRWTYVKLYLPEQATDDLLLSEIAPLVHGLRVDGSADRWHFVRYADPQRHLRLRVRASDGIAPSIVRDCILEKAEALLSADIVERYALDTYDPEYERYGGPEGMDRAERFFTIDSDVCVNALAGKPASTDATIELATATFDAFVRSSPRLDDAILSIQMERHRTLAPEDREILRRLRASDVSPSPALDQALDDDGGAERLAVFAHMHCNRFGLENAAETRVAVLLRSLALARKAATREPRAAASLDHR